METKPTPPGSPSIPKQSLRPPPAPHTCHTRHTREDRKEAKKTRAKDEAAVDAVGEMFQAGRDEEMLGDDGGGTNTSSTKNM